MYSRFVAARMCAQAVYEVRVCCRFGGGTLSCEMAEGRAQGQRTTLSPPCSQRTSVKPRLKRISAAQSELSPPPAWLPSFRRASSSHAVFVAG